MVGVEVGVVPMVGVGVVPVEPLQVLPLTAKLVGTGLLLVQVPLKPGAGLTAALGATAPLYDILEMVTFWPDCETVPFHSCVTV